MAEQDKQGSTTPANLLKAEYTWTLKNFSWMKDPLQSTEFWAKEDEEIIWKLHLFPSVEDKTGVKDKWVSIFLWLYQRPDGEKNMDVRFEFTFKNIAGSTKKQIATTCTFDRNTPKLSYKEFAERKTLLQNGSQSLINDTLVVECKVEWMLDISIEDREDSENRKDINEKIDDDLNNILKKQLHTDVILVAQGQEKKAHKAILANKSPVFAAMFSHEMKENITGRVDIQDLDFKTLKQMVSFIYSGRLSKSAKSNIELLFAAEKYDLESLKSSMEDSFIKSLNFDNVVEIIIASDASNSSRLKKAAMNFALVKHSQRLLESTQWKTMVESHPHLVEESVRFLCQAPAKEENEQQRKSSRCIIL